MHQLAVLYVAFDVVPSPKGASTHISYFTTGLVDAGYRVQLVTTGRPGLPAQDVYRGARIQRVHAQDTNFLRRAAVFSQTVARHLEDAPPYDVVHFRGIWGGLPAVAAAARMGHRTLFEVNGLPSIELKYHYPALRGRPVLDKLRRQEAAVLCRADQVICPSRVTAEYVRSLDVAPERVTVIPNGVDTGLFAPTSDPELSADPPCLLYLGTLAEWQGLALLLDALSLVLAQRPVKLQIVGRGRKLQRKALRKRVRKLGLTEWVTLDGAQPHKAIPALLNQAAVCVAPLNLNDRNVTQGCCPLKVLEYMACRRPIVAANLPVVRELVRQDVDALLFTPDDPQNLARALLRLLDDPALAGRLADSAHARACQAFTWKRACAALLEVYEGLKGC